MNDEIKLQYQLSTGRWVDCNGGFDGKQEDRTEEFFIRCEQETGKTRNEIIVILKTGETVRNDSEDWYSNCRDGNTADRISAEHEATQIATDDYPEGRKLDCGHIVYNKIEVMSASMGSSCSDCYDRMSD